MYNILVISSQTSVTANTTAVIKTIGSTKLSMVVVQASTTVQIKKDSNILGDKISCVPHKIEPTPTIDTNMAMEPSKLLNVPGITCRVDPHPAPTTAPMASPTPVANKPATLTSMPMSAFC